MSTIDDVKMLEFPEHGDSRGYLVVVEGGEGRHIPFVIKRIFYIYGPNGMYGPGDDVVRGKHANRHSEFCLVNVRGSCKVRAVDCDGGEKVFSLDKPHRAVYLPTMIWKEMYDFSEDSILLVLSGNYYDKGEYISDFDEFLRSGKS